MKTLPVNHNDLRAAVEEAWQAFECAAGFSRFGPMPILFFGNLDAYRKAPLRVVTVGLNPSSKAFPPNAPFEQFPKCDEIMSADDEIASAGYEPYLDDMCSYFRIKPCSWFKSYEWLLRGVGTSYYTSEPSAALHTDIASPVATDPAWSSLGASTREALLAKGVPLWHQLLEILMPHVVLLSIAEKHLSRIKFKPLENGWQTLHTFEFTKDGARQDPYEVRSRWYAIMGEPSLFVFGRATQTPFGSLSKEHRKQVGELAKEKFFQGPPVL